jgi:hypothetical protein
MRNLYDGLAHVFECKSWCCRARHNESDFNPKGRAITPFDCSSAFTTRAAASRASENICIAARGGIWRARGLLMSL